MKRLWLWIKRVAGVGECHSIKELVAYIPEGDLARLNYWVVQTMFYESDKTLKDEWQDIHKLLALPNKKRKPDCEERCVIKKEVINHWKNHTAKNLVCVHPNPDNNHAVTFIWKTDGTKIWIDDGGFTFYSSKHSVADVIKAQRPDCKYYFFATNRGEIIGERIFL